MARALTLAKLEADSDRDHLIDVRGADGYVCRTC
jgi:hypothetical protein